MKFTFIGWVIFLLLLYLFSKNKTGNKIIYFSLFLILTLLLLTNYKEIVGVMVKGE